VTLSITDDIERKSRGDHEGSFYTVKAIDVREQLKNVSIVAGHFFWDVWQHLPSALSLKSLKGVDSAESSNHVIDADLKDERGGEVTDIKAVPPCIIIGRHPIGRAISYYYQRCYRSENCVGYQRNLNDLSVAELSSFIKYKRQGGFRSDNITTVVLDEGLEDAACRALANEKSTTGLTVGVDALHFPPPLSQEAITRALDNSEKCVVGILERWEETKEVLKFWFPWLDFAQESDRRRMFFTIRKETIMDIKPELAAEILRINSCDMLLYDKMVRLFESELSIYKEISFSILQ
jgi:hypothetical protein